MSRRHTYRRRRFRPFRQGLAAKAPGLILLAGLVVSVGAHVGLGVALQNQTFGKIDPALLLREQRPVRVKRALFDEITPPAGAQGQGAADVGQTPEALADALMQEVQTASLAPLDPALVLREVPEPVMPRLAEALPMASDAMDIEALLGDVINEPSEMVFVEGSAFDAPRAQGPAASALSGDLLAALAAADGGLPATNAGLEAMGWGINLAPGSAPGIGPGIGPGTGRGSGGHGSGAAVAGPIPGGAAFDFLGFGEIGPQDFEPPERLDDDFLYAVTRFDPVAGDGYFRVKITGKRSLRKLATMPKDVVFMVDTSKSIPDKTIKQITEAIKQSIRALNDGDRFNMVFFNDKVSFFAGEPVPPTRENLGMADRWMRNVRGRGRTDVNLALRQLLRRDIEPGRVYELILISDGRPTLGVLNTRELINLITRENDLAASIYCVGIGRKQDNRLLDFLAYRNKGFSVNVPTPSKVVPEIVGLMSRLRYPIVTDVQVRFAGQDMGEVYPLTLPNVHQGESFELYGRFTKPGPFTVQITGYSGGKPVDLTFRADLNHALPGRDEVAQGWAFWKLHHLYSEIIRLGEREQLLKEINKLRQRYDLETLY